MCDTGYFWKWKKKNRNAGIGKGNCSPICNTHNVMISFGKKKSLERNMKAYQPLLIPGVRYTYYCLQFFAH